MSAVTYVGLYGDDALALLALIDAALQKATEQKQREQLRYMRQVIAQAVKPARSAKP